jgi:putative intracellular protease/amidase
VARSPTVDELAAWQVLTLAARSHGEAVVAVAEASARLPSADRLLAARKAVRGFTLPDDQQMAGSPMVRLVRFVDRWAVMSSIDRHAFAAELRNLAVEAAEQAGFEE